VERGGLGLVNAELHDRNIRFRVHVAQHRPCAVIKTPA
jgi:hypothetical protein